MSPLNLVNMSKTPRLILLAVALLPLYLLIMMLFRLIFWAYFDEVNNALPGADLLKALYIGFKFDLRLSLLMLLPLLLLGWLRLFSPYSSRFNYRAWIGYLTLMLGTIVVFNIFDFAYYAYLQKPLDATILRFSADWDIAIDMMWQTYPIIWLFVFLFVIMGIYVFIVHRILQRTEAYTPHSSSRWYKTAVVGVTFLTVVAGLYGKFSYYPLRWSDAFTSTHTFAAPVTLNPVLYFMNTMKNKQITYSEEKTREYYALLADYLGVNHKDSSKLNYTRHIDKTGPLAASKPNIVLVFLESFAAYKTSTFNNPLNPTPHFDEIAKNGLSFKRFYTPHSGTARSVFTAITGIPDIETNKTSSRNPLVVDQHTLVNAFPDYEKFYFLGGSANWGNIRGLLSHNIPGLNIYEEGSYKSERVDVWGISDLHLFEEAGEILGQQQKPFFAIIQTSGNHRPYTIPEDNRGFVFDNHDDSELKQHGFISNGEYNSFRYMDHSLGHFMQQAKKQSWFDNTIFAFFGDHGISGFGGKHFPAFETPLDLTGLHVPFVIYAPKLIPQSKTFDKVASEVDVLPTLAALAGAKHNATTLGRDLLDPQYDDKRYAFGIVHTTNPELRLIGDDFVFRIRADGSDKFLYDTRSEHFKDNVITQNPEVAAKMEQLCLGIYETANYIRHHNPNSAVH